ncbi:MAG: hypothetical protein QOJ07_303 [Thermoleophilaceae bacterium]|jgi:hypothetical protein|nr:hypothetical protein [Thermoleophilaceae bacterium]
MSSPTIVLDQVAGEPIELFDAWLFAATEATLELQSWTAAPSERKAEAHAVYVAALDREEQAALVLGNRLRAPATEED